MDQIKFRLRPYFLAGIFGTLVFVLLTYSIFLPRNDQRQKWISSSLPKLDGKPYDVHIPHLPAEWYARHCFPEVGSGRSIGHIYQKLMALRENQDPRCQEISMIFQSMFQIEAVEAPIVLPDEFKSEVMGWLGNDSVLFLQVMHQIVYKVVNRFTFEESVFNFIRSKRPQSKPKEDPWKYVEDLTKSTASTCDFCSYETHTAKDVFGRIVNDHTASCSNTFKLSKFHGLFFPKSHHPLNISYEVLEELFLQTSYSWFLAAHRQDRNQRYPALLWDTLPHAGASQVHPHVHGLLTNDRYVGEFESMHDAAQRYFLITGRPYWTDYLKVHWALGLAFSESHSFILIPLNPRKDHEYIILANSLTQSFTKALFRIFDGYKNRLKSFCFSAAGVYPPLWSPTEIRDNVKHMKYSQPGLPLIFRIGVRGVCNVVASDVSSLELYTINNINSDLEKTVLAIT